MPDENATNLTPEHRDFYERFQSFWAAPSGARVAELIAPHATIRFTGAGTFSGAEYVDAMQGMLDSMVDMEDASVVDDIWATCRRVRRITRNDARPGSHLVGPDELPRRRAAGLPSAPGADVSPGRAGLPDPRIQR